MSQIPTDSSLDSTLALSSDGYEFISKRCNRLETDVFQTRLMLQPTICMRGEEAARLVYDNDRFKRSGAAPGRVEKTLFGQGGVQGLDGEAHRQRKELFMSLMGPEGIQQLVHLMEKQWEAYLNKWTVLDEVVLFHEAKEILCRATCQWMGIPLTSTNIEQCTNDMAAMIDASGAVGPRHWRGRTARRRAEKWIGQLVQQVRSGELEVDQDRALYAFATYRDTDGALLDEEVAAVELLNVLRPTVAVARYIVFAALALHHHPEIRQKVQEEGAEYVEMFVQEVRRFYPFFPFVGALVRDDFEWNGYRFQADTRVLFDLYGTNRDRRLWEKPEVFRPERFRQWDGSAFTLVPQGGGDHHQHHRCAGEWITIEILKTVTPLLTESMAYEVPDQDLSIDLSRIPAIPKSRFVMTDVQRKR